jgi:predicted thioesterase
VVTILAPGLSAVVEAVVDESLTAAALGSGMVAGLATPAMIALMEGAAVRAVAGALSPGESTVGIRVEVSHQAPTPVGARVTARAVLAEVDGKRLRFRVEAEDEAGPIGAGIHERVLIRLETFEEKLRTRIPRPGNDLGGAR